MAKSDMKQSVPVFVSSTYEDLIPYRNEVQRVLIRLEQIIKGMEYFGSSHKKPLDVCLGTVRNCKVFVGIIGMRYGSIEETTEKSFTQLEYEEAIKNKIPTLMYIIDENHPISPRFVDKDERAALLSDFKAIITKNHTISYFTTPEDLGKKLSSDLLDVLESLDDIKIEYNDNVNAKENFDEVFKKFIFRPAKYSAQEGILNIKITDKEKSCANLKLNVIRKLHLTFGDTVSVPVFVIDEKTNTNLIPNYVYMYGEKELADWIEKALPGTIAKVKVRLEFFVSQEIVSYDEGSILKDVLYKNLVLLEVINEK